MTKVEKEFLINYFRRSRDVIDNILDRLYYYGDSLCYDEFDKDAHNIHKRIKSIYDEIDYKSYIINENNVKSKDTIHNTKDKRKKSKILKQIKRSSV